LVETSILLVEKEALLVVVVVVGLVTCLEMEEMVLMTLAVLAALLVVDLLVVDLLNPALEAVDFLVAALVPPCTLPMAALPPKCQHQDKRVDFL
jgi:hypothetical protein